MELLQDAVVVLLSVTLSGMGFVFLYRVWREIIALGNLQEGLSNIIFVVITIELYRLLVHYLRYHKVDLNILVEVGVSVIIQKVVLVGVDEFTMQQLVGISLILVSLWRHPLGRHARGAADRSMRLLFSQAATEIRDLARERTRGKFR
jgi:uncharacterized membrane protein (DUF373 family)